MGFSSFVQAQSAAFLRDFDARQLPRDIGRFGEDAARQWIWDQFTTWFEERKEELLAEEYCRRGWGKMMLGEDESGRTVHTCRIYPECRSEVEAWLADKID
jgi:hypothetical protein